MRSSTSRRAVRTAGLLVLVLLLAGCTAGPASRWATGAAAPAGFFAGLWHGILVVVALVVSFFSHDVRIYELNNSGAGYDIGFVLGILAVYGGGTHVRVSRRRKAPPGA